MISIVSAGALMCGQHPDRLSGEKHFALLQPAAKMTVRAIANIGSVRIYFPYLEYEWTHGTLHHDGHRFARPWKVYGRRWTPRCRPQARKLVGRVRHFTTAHEALPLSFPVVVAAIVIRNHMVGVDNHRGNRRLAAEMQGINDILNPGFHRRLHTRHQRL